MPLVTSPKQTFPVVLACDRGAVRNLQTRFFAYCLSKDDWRKYEAAGRDPEKRALPGHLQMAETWAALELALAGWANLLDDDGNPIAFSKAAIRATLADHEAMELYWLIDRRSLLTDDDRKNFGWASPSSSADAAPATAPAATNAATSPA